MLSVVVITKNEANDIAQCLESVTWADEIIVLDSGSNDDTVSICQRYTDKVWITDWPGFGPQKQRALEKAKGDWVLSIDADERVTPGLRAEIERAIVQNQHEAYLLPRYSSYCGHYIKYGGWYPDYVLRLFQRKKSHFSPDIVHESVIVDGRIGKLTGFLLHNSYADLEEVVTKINSYSSLGAQKLFERGKKSSLSSAIFHALWKFIFMYFLKLGFLDGRRGLMLAISSAEGVYYKYAKLFLLNEHSSKSNKN